MAGRPEIRYGTPNFEMIRGWLSLPADQDGPFWAVNLMKYRAVADYGDGSVATRSGRDADDEYSPLGSLAAIGAMVTFVADVVTQTAGTPTWDRIGIVRYPSRAAFLAMQQRDDFKSKHVHKEAGMEFTIVMSCRPTSTGDGASSGDGSLVMRVSRLTGAAPTRTEEPGVRPVARFDVEGVIVGDERQWSEVRFDWVDSDVLPALTDASQADEQFVMTLRPTNDRLVTSILPAPSPGSE
jgi:hypothetical protein